MKYHIISIFNANKSGYLKKYSSQKETYNFTDIISNLQFTIDRTQGNNCLNFFITRVNITSLTFFYFFTLGKKGKDLHLLYLPTTT